MFNSSLLNLCSQIETFCASSADPQEYYQEEARYAVPLAAAVGRVPPRGESKVVHERGAAPVGWVESPGGRGGPAADAGSTPREPQQSPSAEAASPQPPPAIEADAVFEAGECHVPGVCGIWLTLPV